MNISEFNINAEFIACNHITTNELNPLVEKPYHTKASIFALCTKGVLKTIINHTQFRVEANTLLVIPPETFVQLLHTSDDAEIYVVIFSQQLIQSSGAGKVMMDKFHIIGKHYIFSSIENGLPALCRVHDLFVTPLPKNRKPLKSSFIANSTDLSVTRYIRTLSGTP